MNKETKNIYSEKHSNEIILRANPSDTDYFQEKFPNPRNETKRFKILCPPATKQLMTKPLLIKNLLVVSCSFLLLFTAYGSVSSLQSTMNSEQGVGVASQAVIYVFMCFSSLLLPSLVIKRLGCKTTMILSIFCYLPYIASNFYPHWGTLIPSAAICGIGASLLWSSQGTYLNELVFLYLNYTKSSVESVSARFFGLFGLFYMSSDVWGNLISYYALRPEDPNEYNALNDSLDMCGAYFCGRKSVEGNIKLTQPSEEKRFLLTGILMGFGALAFLVTIIFMDSLGTENILQKDRRTANHLVATFKLCRNVNLLLLLPLTFYTGLQQGFYIGDYTKAYVGCAWGVYHVGFVTISYGAACAVGSPLSGLLVKCLGQVPVFLFATGINIAACVSLLLWQPNPQHPFLFFVMAGVWGLFTSIFWAQLHAFYGTLFKDDEAAAFGNYYLWSSVGHGLAFGYSDYLCTNVKIYVLLGIVVLGIGGYLAVKLRMTLGKKAEYKMNGDKGNDSLSKKEACTVQN